MKVLYTMQRPGRDITRREKPHPEYTEPLRGAHYRIASFLGWPSWVWCFSSVDDFEAPLVEAFLSFDPRSTFCELRVPDRRIKWLSMDLHLNEPHRTPVAEMFFGDEEVIRRRVTRDGEEDVPEALVRAPIRAEWIDG
jgi:hypothetical protein